MHEKVLDAWDIARYQKSTSEMVCGSSVWYMSVGHTYPNELLLKYL